MTFPLPPVRPLPAPTPNADPTGLRYDRADLDDTTTATAGDGWQPSGQLVRVDLKPCGCLAGDFCTCACDTTRDRIELAHAPVYVMPPFNLRELAARHITAVELDRQMRGGRLMPKRIQRKRTAGWRMPEGAVYVGRPSRFGNPFTFGRVGDTRRWTGWFVGDVRDVWAEYGTFTTRQAAVDHAVTLYRERSFSWSPDTVAYVRERLAGKDLACWCPLDQPCHADVLLEIANGGGAS